MASTGISEFTFGFAFLFEQAQRNWAGLKAAPILPSLRQEANDAWDAHLPVQGTDFYYQFKLSDYLWRGNASFIQDGTYAQAYYRIALHRRDYNRQHQRLRAQSVVHPHTYYVAPEFTRIDEFNRSFLAQEITENSRLIPVAECRDINDGDQHYITYRQGNPGWIEHSEPKRHERSSSGKDLEALYRHSAPTWRPIDRSFAEGVLESTMERIGARSGVEDSTSDRPHLERLVQRNDRHRSPQAVLRQAADLLSIYYGLTLVVVGSPE